MADKQPWEMDWGAPAGTAAAAPAGAAAPWEMDWNGAGDGPGVAKDVGMSILGGARDAPLAVTTTLPGMRELATRGVQKMIDLAAPESGIDLPKLEEETLKREIVPGVPVRRVMQMIPGVGLNYGPTFGEASKNVEDLGVPDYEPKTGAGRITKMAVEAAPIALSGSGAAIPNLVKGAALPALGSEALGDRFAGTWLETPSRLVGALLGGVAGHGAGMAGSALRTGAAARSVAQDARALTGDQGINAGAVRRVAKNIADDQVTPESAARTMGELGPEGMLLDAGRQLRGRAEAIATQPGPGQNRVLDAVEGRTGEFGEGTANRVRGTLDTTMGPGVNVVDLTKGIGEIVDRHAKPLYDSVMADHPVVKVPEEITSRPAVAAAMKNATTLAKQYGEKLESPTETQTILKGPGYHMAEDVTAPAQTSLRYWDYVKKDLDRRINGYMKSGGASELGSADKADLGGLIDARNALRDHLDQATEGAYKQARDVWAHKPQLTEAIDQGRAALSTKLLPEELHDTYTNLSIPQQAMYRVGMRREIDRIMDTARNDGAAARRVLDTDQNREKIATVFGEDAAAAIDRRIAAETKFQEATNKIGANSRTAVRRELVKDTEEPSQGAPPQANVLGYLHKAGTGILSNLRNTGMENTRTGIGSLMTTPAHQVPDLVRLLAGYNQRAAGMAPPTVGGSASLLARSLALPMIANAQANQQR